MKKKILSLFLVVAFLFAITSCVTTTTTYTATFDADGGTVNGESIYTEKFEQGKGIDTLPAATKEGHSFIGWYIDDKKVTSISADTNSDVTLVAHYQVKQVFNYNTPVTDSIELTETYEGKNFLEDGIGEVTVQQYVDGDTTIFKCGNQAITIRYEGIDTPESTYKVEPWGFAASKHTKEALKNAKTIVLQTDNGKPGKDNVDTTGNRYLAWVWVDGRLLNLELVELALANSKASDTTLSKEFTSALTPALQAKVRIYGEKDPDYDYSTSYTDMSLKELHENYGTTEAILNSKDVGKKVRVSGVITRMVGANSAYIQQTAEYDDNGKVETYGVYLYGGYNLNNRLVVGNTVIVSGTIGYYNGSLQISSVTQRNTNVQSFGDSDKIVINEVEDLKNYLEDEVYNLGNIIKVTTPLKVISYYDAKNDKSNATTLTAEYYDVDNHRQTVTIRIDNNITLLDPDGNRIDTGEYFKGKTFKSLICVLGYYDPSDNGKHDGSVQLMLTRMEDIEYEVNE